MTPKLNDHIFDPAKVAFNTQILILGPILVLILSMFLGMILGTILGTILGLILGSVLGSINIEFYFLVTSISAADAGNPYTSLELILKKSLVSYNGLKSIVEN